AGGVARRLRLGRRRSPERPAPERSARDARLGSRLRGREPAARRRAGRRRAPPDRGRGRHSRGLTVRSERIPDRAWPLLSLITLTAVYGATYGRFVGRFFSFDDFTWLAMTDQIHVGCAAYDVRAVLDVRAVPSRPGLVVVEQPAAPLGDDL